jgi:hypothetical protein
MENTMRTVKPIEEELNARLGKFHTAMQTGSNHQIYTTKVHDAAAHVYESILEACSLGFEVKAYKDNGRILRFMAVGPLRSTSFPYSRNPSSDFLTYSDSEFDECELAVIESFKLCQDLPHAE